MNDVVLFNTLMTREEIVQRLRNGEDGFDLSLEKWERMKEYIKCNGAYDFQYGSYSSLTCPLCIIHSGDRTGNIPLCGKYEDYLEGYGLLQCPLKHCGVGSVWFQFALNPCERTAEAVIHEIKKARGDYG